MNFRGCGKLRGAKPVEKRSAARFAHPLRGAEVLVAVRGPSPGEGGGKNSQKKCKIHAENEKIGNSFIHSRKNVDDFWLKFGD